MGRLAKILKQIIAGFHAVFFPNIEFASIFELSPIGVGQNDIRTGRFVRVNDRLCKITGFSKEELLSMTPRDLVHPDDVNVDWEKFQKMIRGELEEYDNRKRYIRKNGEIVWIQVTARIARDRWGRPARTIGIIQDITEQKKGEEIRQQTEALWRIVTENASDLIFIKDRNRRFLFANGAVNQYFNKTSHEIIGKCAEELLQDPTAIEIVNTSDRRVLETGISEDVDTPITGPGGARAFQTRKCPFRDASGQVAGFVAISRDITERLEMEKALAAALKKAESNLQMRDRFISIASHELRTPLTVLKINIELRRRNLEMRGEPNSQDKKVQEIIRQDRLQLDRLDRLVDDMLNVSQIDAGRLQIEKERIDISSLAEEVVTRFANLHDGGREKLTLSFKTAGSIIGEWDPGRIDQVLTNLISNAIKYGEGKPIQVSIENLTDQVEIRVTDEGCGISKTDQDQIFDAFNRGSNTSEISGLGLGLYIVRMFVLRHGGTVRVESDSGKGATFTVSLPILKKI